MLILNQKKNIVNYANNSAMKYQTFFYTYSLIFFNLYCFLEVKKLKQSAMDNQNYEKQLHKLNKYKTRSFR